ncbi:hypothetical protein OAT01_04995 [Pseudomonadales bacterium]|nr:hypothetical protein [Pseudomonadales bacterium]
MKILLYSWQNTLYNSYSPRDKNKFEDINMRALALILPLAIVACGPSQEKIQEVSTITCNIIGETRNMDAAQRIKETNSARESLGLKAFLGRDDEILEAFKWGACEELVSDSGHSEKISSRKKQGEEWLKKNFKIEKIAAGGITGVAAFGFITIEHSCLPAFIRTELFKVNATVGSASLDLEYGADNANGGCNSSHMTTEWRKSFILQNAREEIGVNGDAGPYTKYKISYLSFQKNKDSAKPIP